MILKTYIVAQKNHRIRQVAVGFFGVEGCGWSSKLFTPATKLLHEPFESMAMEAMIPMIQNAICTIYQLYTHAHTE